MTYPVSAGASLDGERPLRDRLFRPTLPELWTFLALALPGLAALLANVPTVDLAYQLRAGAEILDGRGIPATDTWTFTAAGLPWLDQQWGAQALLSATFEVVGWTGLAVLRAVFVVLVSALLLVAIRRRAPAIGQRTAAWLALTAFVVMAPALALRPQLIGMALFAASLAVLGGRRERPGAMWLLPVAAVAWANVHGSFVLAPVLVGLAWLEDVHERWPHASRTLLVAVVTGAATLLTPFGVGAWRYALGLATNRDVTARISEWRPPALGDATGILFWASVVLVAIAVVAIARRRRGLPWPAILTLAVFATLGAVAARGVAWWPGIAVVTLAGLVSVTAPTASRPDIEPRRSTHGSAINAGVAAILVLGGIVLLPVWRPVDRGLDAPAGLLGQAPSGITAALRDLTGAEDRVWNPQAWGSWFEFVAPVASYALDSRIEVIPASAWAESDLVSEARAGWSEVLDARGVTIVVTDGASTSALARALADSASWSLAHADDAGTVWVRVGR